MKHKFQQFVYAFLICLVGTSFHPKWGIGIALSIAVLKNIKDSIFTEQGWSWGALAAAVAGGATGFVAYVAIDQMQLITNLMDVGIVETVMSAVESFLP